jgi:hypothetical protein
MTPPELNALFVTSESLTEMQYALKAALHAVNELQKAVDLHAAGRVEFDVVDQAIHDFQYATGACIPESTDEADAAIAELVAAFA